MELGTTALLLAAVFLIGTFILVVIEDRRKP